MIYDKFTIRHFRCFSEEQELLLAKPQEGKIGSGITYIVGANNSGKTTLIEGLWLRNNQRIRASEKRQEGDPVFCLYADGKIKRRLEIPRSESYTLIENPAIESREDLFEIITSRRHWESSANDTGSSRAFIEQSVNTQQNPRRTQDIRTASILKDIESDDDRYKDFTKLVQRIIPEFSKWAVGFEDHEYIEYVSSENIKHKTDFLGDGVISAIRILAHLFEGRTSGLIIDEPELSLHPLSQKALIELIAEHAEHRQIIISTHSPYFVSWEYIKNGAVLNRVTKNSDTNSSIHSINNYEKYEKLVAGANWQQPYLMDVVSKEIFFQDNILFTEGQEDVGLLKTTFADHNIHFFGYGVRGYLQFPFALELARDLGIKKACVLIDSPSDTSLNPNEETVYNELEKEYGNLYRIIRWNKTDIRDKRPIQIPEKVGYFTNDGKLKPKDQLDDFEEKINSVIEYFSKTTEEK